MKLFSLFAFLFLVRLTFANNPPDEGFILRNHDYDTIASQSKEEHNYLKDCFWAENKRAELNIPDLTVTFSVRMDDVSDRIFNLPKDEEKS